MVAARTEGSADWRLPDSRAPYLRGSVIELLPDPLSPLFATLALPVWNAATPELGRRLGIVLPDDMFTTVNGYAYVRFGGIRFSGAQKLTLLRMVPRLARMLWQSRRRWEDAARPAYAAVVARWDGPDLERIPASRLLDGVREVARASVQHYFAIQTGVLMAAYLSEALFRAAYDRLIKLPGDPSALTFLLGYASAPIRAEQSLYALAAWARRQPGLAASLERLPGQGLDALDGPPPAGLTGDAWQEFRFRWREHLRRFGHAIYDLDFAKEVPADHPAPVLETLRFFLSGQGADPSERQDAAAARREQATRTMLAKLHGPRLLLFRVLLPRAQEYAPLREDALANAGLGWPALRRLVAELGQRLTAIGAIDRADDAYWLTADELGAAAAALDAGRPLETRRDVVAERRTRWAKQRRFTPPSSLPAREGASGLGTAMSMWMPAKTKPVQGSIIQGIGASPGRVVGTARVLRGPDEFSQMRPGEILVARITTPAWTPLFALAAGVVTDVGGPLSHSSIVAREYQIPAVLGTGVATERLCSGQRIAVDGDTGTVEPYF